MSKYVFSKNFESGEEIFRMGDLTREAYIIEFGKVEISSMNEGKKLVFAELGAGEIFGEMSMIDDAPRSATAIALENTQVVIIQRARFQRPLQAVNPLMNMMLRVILIRFRDSIRKFSGMQHESPGIDHSLEEIRGLALSRIKTEKEMRQGFEAGEFQLHYQPIVSLESGRIGGFEALMRWQKEDGGFVSLMDFIPLAEETGLIVELGRFALERAIEDHLRFASWMTALDAASALPYMSVNVSALQFSELSEIDRLAGIIGESGIDPAMIKLEMTETLLVEDPEHAADALGKIKELGVSIAIDDFGTGYSSLSYLHQFPLDTLKIDRSFVNNMDKSESSRRIVKSIADLAHSLEMTIVAEGIEELEQMDALRELGCQYGQGYYMAKPASADEIMELIETKPKW